MHQVRCHHCKQWVGESSRPLQIVAMVKDPRDTEKYIAPPRDTWRCKACGWANVFIATTDPTTWRTVELKDQQKPAA